MDTKTSSAQLKNKCRTLLTNCWLIVITEINRSSRLLLRVNSWSSPLKGGVLRLIHRRICNVKRTILRILRLRSLITWWENKSILGRNRDLQWQHLSNKNVRWVQSMLLEARYSNKHKTHKLWSKIRLPIEFKIRYKSGGQVSRETQRDRWSLPKQ